MTDAHLTDPTGTPKILLVDDTPLNVRLLKEVLRGDQYDIRVAERGDRALELMAEDPPDLILLDVMMPGMDGYEVCRRIKSTAAWRDIPIIIITALNQASDYVEAMQSGADDFMSKPFNQVVLRARVQSYIKSRKTSAALARQEQFRYELLRMVAHDLNNHIGAVLGYIELLLSTNDLSDAGQRRAEKAMRSVEEAARLLRNFMGIEKMESGTLVIHAADVDLGAICRRFTDVREVVWRGRGLSMEMHLSPDLKCEADPDLLERVVQNVLDNAIKYAPEDTPIAITGSVDDTHVTVSIANRGEVIPADELEHMFDKFYQIRTRPEHSRGGSGLGLSFCRMAIERIGGSIYATSPVAGESEGVCVTLRVPRRSAEAPNKTASRKAAGAQTYKQYLEVPHLKA